MVKFVVFCCHHLRGGVDWNNSFSVIDGLYLLSPPSRWCGLKFRFLQPYTGNGWSPPSRWCGLKLLWLFVPASWEMSPPSRWCGLKSSGDFFKEGTYLSPPSRWCGLKSMTHAVTSWSMRHHLRGGVDWNLEREIPADWDSYVTTFAVVWIEI